MQRKGAYLGNALELFGIRRIADLVEEWSILAIIGGSVMGVTVVKAVKGVSHRRCSIVERIVWSGSTIRATG